MMERAQNLDELKSKEKSTRNPDSLCLLPRSPWTRTTAPSSRKEKFLEASTIWNMDLTGEELVKVVGWSGMFSTEEVEEMVLQNFLFLQYEGEGRQHNTTLNIDFAFYSSTNLPFSWMNICNIFLFSICFLFNLSEWPHYEANIRSPFQAFIYRGEVTVARENLNNVLLLILVTAFFKRRRWDTCPPPVRWGQTEK